MATLIQFAKEEQRTDGGEPRPNGPPVVRTGNLRRSIRGDKQNIGFQKYTATVGPTLEYGRVLELGFSNGNQYPYMQPAYIKYLRVSENIMKKHFGKDAR
jgi:hypothetical protein